MKRIITREVGDLTLRQLIHICEHFGNDCLKCPLRKNRACQRPLEASEENLKQEVTFEK